MKLYKNRKLLKNKVIGFEGPFLLKNIKEFLIKKVRFDNFRKFLKNRQFKIKLKKI